jgi:hypothetical protein
MKRFFRACIKFALAASALVSSTSYAQYIPLESGGWEFGKCVVPVELSFAREYENGAWITNRYVRYAANQPAYKFVPYPWAPPYPKNPESMVTHGPAHLSNCSDRTADSVVRSSSTIHSLTFRFRAYGLFDTGVGDHIVALQRAYFPDLYSQGQRDGIGVAMYANYQAGGRAIFAQRPNNIVYDSATNTYPYYNSQASGGFTLRDGEVYEITMRANAGEITYHVINVGNLSETYWATYQVGVANVNGIGFGIVVLCKDANAACEINQSWRLDIWGMTAGEM